MNSKLAERIVFRTLRVMRTGFAVWFIGLLIGLLGAGISLHLSHKRKQEIRSNALRVLQSVWLQVDEVGALNDSLIRTSATESILGALVEHDELKYYIILDPENDFDVFIVYNNRESGVVVVIFKNGIHLLGLPSNLEKPTQVYNSKETKKTMPGYQ